MSASSDVLIHLHDAHKIFTAPVEKHVHRASTVRRARRYLLCVWGCCGDPTQGNAPFMLQHGGCYGYGPDSSRKPRGLEWDRKQLALGRLKWCLGLSHTPQDPPHSARSVVGACVCTTSHQGEEGGGGGGRAGLLSKFEKTFQRGFIAP